MFHTPEAVALSIQQIRQDQVYATAHHNDSEESHDTIVMDGTWHGHPICISIEPGNIQTVYSLYPMMQIWIIHTVPTIAMDADATHDTYTHHRCVFHHHIPHDLLVLLMNACTHQDVDAASHALRAHIHHASDPIHQHKIDLLTILFQWSKRHDISLTGRIMDSLNTWLYPHAIQHTNHPNDPHMPGPRWIGLPITEARDLARTMIPFHKDNVPDISTDTYLTALQHAQALDIPWNPAEHMTMHAYTTALRAGQES